MKYMSISYFDFKVKTWTAPQFVPGVDEEAKKNFIEGITRTCKLGRIAPENEGLDCYKIGEFDDNTGVYTPVTPEPLVKLENLL